MAIIAMTQAWQSGGHGLPRPAGLAMTGPIRHCDCHVTTFLAMTGPIRHCERSEAIQDLWIATAFQASQ